MGFIDSVANAFKKYFVFSGRASRSEFWYFLLFLVLGDFISGLTGAAIHQGDSSAGSSGMLGILFFLLTLIPNFAVTIRRLHDVDRRGWWILLPGAGGALMPFSISSGILAFGIGMILLLYWYCKPGTVGENRFGNDPLGTDAMAVAPAEILSPSE